MASKSKRNRQRRKRKEALLAAPDVAITVAVKEKKMGGGMMVPPERETYNKGRLVVDLVEKIIGKQTKDVKGRMVDQEQNLRQLTEIAESDPRALDDLSDEDFKEVMGFLPQKIRANMGLADDPLDNMAERIKGMNPEDAAKNLELFNDMEEIFEYTNSLNPSDARKFMNSLSNEDKAIFGGELPDIQSTLRPREVRGNFAEGGKFPDLTGDGKVTQADILKGRDVFQEGGEVPVDTYPNIPPEQMAAVEASQLPDQQMEDKFIDYVVNEALQPEEQTYLMNALEGDPQLSMIFDKVVGTASEFTGSGEVAGPGTGVSDSIPARLSDGEFVMTRKATDQIGADRLQRMMDEAERAYDGGLMRKGEETDLEDNMNKVMMSSNQMPSLNVRQR
tara:strand:+ start:1802 stop:2974 length:1173 start_codon:yes stop_codon:yes gene_type:complete